VTRSCGHGRLRATPHYHAPRTVLSVSIAPDSSVSTRDLVVLEALKCFADMGYDGTSLNDIAAGVGIRRPSLLHHFASKEILYREVFERFLSEFWVQLEAALSEPGLNGLDLVEHTLGVGFDFFTVNPDVVRLVRREAIDGGVHLGVELMAALGPWFERATSWFQREMDAGNFRVLDPHQLLLTGYGALLSYFSDAPFIEHLLGASPLDADRLIQRRSHVIDLFRAALTP
jgi:TetR/AcrR family transcriptional regulator